MKADISVITPLYHGKKYLPDILNMLQQNISENCQRFQLELVLINDSPDEAIANNDIAYVKDFKVILLTNPVNRGIHYSRVRGLAHATGQYIMFFDQDDRIANNYFSSQLLHLHNEDVVVANGIAQYARYEKMLYRYWIMQWTVKHIWFYIKYDCRIISPGQCLIKASSIPNEWKQNIINENGADDFFLWLLMLAKKNKFGINREKLYIHVYTNENLSLNADEMERSRAEVFKHLRGIIDTRYLKKLQRDLCCSTKKNFLVSCIEWINGAR